MRALLLALALLSACATPPPPCPTCPECPSSYWTLPCWDYQRLPDGGAGELVPVPCRVRTVEGR